MRISKQTLSQTQTPDRILIALQESSLVESTTKTAYHGRIQMKEGREGNLPTKTGSLQSQNNHWRLPILVMTNIDKVSSIGIERQTRLKMQMLSLQQLAVRTVSPKRRDIHHLGDLIENLVQITIDSIQIMRPGKVKVIVVMIENWQTELEMRLLIE